MKLPAVAIAAAFICGIVLGLRPVVANQATPQVFVVAGFAIAASLVIAGILLTRVQRLAVGAALSMSAWIVLGALSAAIAQQPLPRDHVLARLDSGEIDLHTPLRWH